MDIATHAMSGLILAAPLLPTRPVTASCFVLGSVLPDLDVLARVFGKVAFLRCHQTFTHALPGIALTVLGVFLLLNWAGLPEVWGPLALAGAMLLHALADSANTYGVALLAPFNRRRFCTEWVFFIDGVTVAATVAAFLPVAADLAAGRTAPWSISASYACFVLAYAFVRFLLHRRARRMSPPGTSSLVPSAFWPWRFYGYAEIGGRTTLFELNAFTGVLAEEQVAATPDALYLPWLNGVVEYRLMRALSSGYRLVEARTDSTGVTLICQDLRTRNFGGTFGKLEAAFDQDGHLKGKVFHV